MGSTEKLCYEVWWGACGVPNKRRGIATHKEVLWLWRSRALYTIVSKKGSISRKEKHTAITNFIWTYLHKYWVFFDDISCIGKPSRRPFQ